MTANIGRRRRWVAVVGAILMAFPSANEVRAQLPSVDLTGGRARVRIKASQLSDAIDALGRAAGFKVTYDGARPSAMIYNAEIDTASVPQTLFRLLEGQNVNYGVVFDKSGRRVTSLLIVGVAAKSAGGSVSGGSPVRPQGFQPPRAPRAELPPVDDEPVLETAPEPEPTPEASPSPTPVQGPRAFPQSPFGPRPPGFNPPRPTPSP